MKPTQVHIVRNRSSREGAKPKLIFLHDTEGGTIESVLVEFDNPDAEASAHVINNRKGQSARAVRDSEKAWSECEYNRLSLSIEQAESFASESKRQWFTSHDKQLSNTAAWCAEWSIKYGIPLRKGIILGNTVAIIRSGIVQHKDAGSIGCGHSDCGPGYPQRYVVRLAKLIVEEHHLGRPHSKQATRLRRRINRQRKRYGLEPFHAPHK